MPSFFVVIHTEKNLIITRIFIIAAPLFQGITLSFTPKTKGQHILHSGSWFSLIDALAFPLDLNLPFTICSSSTPENTILHSKIPLKVSYSFSLQISLLDSQSYLHTNAHYLWSSRNFVLQCRKDWESIQAVTPMMLWA